MAKRTASTSLAPSGGPQAKLKAAPPAAGDDALVERTRRNVRAILARLEKGSQECRPKVEALLRLPRAGRWREADENPELHQVPVVVELLRRAQQPGSPPHQTEALALLALQLVPRLRFGKHPTRWAGDLAARAWMLLAELALARRDLPAADFAVDSARAHLGIGSGDAQLAFEVGLSRAFLDWAEGRALAAAETFKTLERLARDLADTPRQAEVALWRFRLCDQLEDHSQAAVLYADAATRLPPEALRQALLHHTQIAERFGLTRSGHARKPPRPPLSGSQE